jgi:hypothetical protein
MIAVAAHSAAITEACASSPGRIDRAGVGGLIVPVAVILLILPADPGSAAHYIDLFSESM